MDWKRAMRQPMLAVIVLAVLPAGRAAEPEVRQYTVMLEAPSVGRRLALDRGKRGRERSARVDAASMDTMARAVARTQQPVVARMRGRGVEILGSVSRVLNAVFVRATPLQAEEIRGLPGVGSVVPAREFQLELDAVADLVGLAPVRSGPLPATGEGIKIAIIDSGLDFDHEAFRDDSLPHLPGYPKGRPEHLRFASRKVIAVRSYTELLNSGDPETSTPDDTTPHDNYGHGTAVAMIAAGATVDTPAGRIEGIAPKAYLGVYKVSGTPGINSWPTTQSIIAAIDDAVADGMDVLNLSLGARPYSSWGACAVNPPPAHCHLVVVAAQSAVVDFGRVVVAAAGNSGASGVRERPMLNSILSPAIAPDVIAVAATENSRKLVQTVRAGAAAFPALSGSGPAVDGSLSGGLVHAGDLGDPLACTPFAADSLARRLVLVERGTCTFREKIEHADAAGAMGVVVFNSGDLDALLEMARAEETDIPAYFVGASAGNSLAALTRQAPDGQPAEVTLDAVPVARATDPTEVGWYSSRGPSPGLNLKPDLAAPGTFVYTAAARQPAKPYSFRPSGFEQFSGTSMAAPVVAGAAALVWQAHPRLTAREVSSALVNTASETVYEDGEPARVTSVGAGLLNVAASLDPIATVEPPTVGFGVLSDRELPVWQDILVTNRGNSPHRYRMRVEPRDIDARAGVRLDGFEDISFDLDPDEYVRVRVELRGSVPSPGSWEGVIRISREGRFQSLRVPYLYVVGGSGVDNALPLTDSGFTGLVGESAIRRIAARFVDRSGAPVPSEPVSFVVRQGDAVVESASPSTDAFGVARATVRFSGSPGEQMVVAAASGIEVPFRYEAAEPRPAITGVVDSASLEARRAFAPGSLVSVFGSGFADFEGEALPSPLPLVLKSVSASFDHPEIKLSLPAPVYFASGTEVGLQVPWELAGLNFAHLKIRVWNRSGPEFVSEPVAVDLTDVSPGIFQVPVPGGSVPAVYHEDGTLVTQDAPARPGGRLLAVMNGNGPLVPPVPTGKAATGPSPTLHAPAVTLGGLEAAVTYSGAVPGVAGVSEVAFIVPANSTAGDLELLVTTHGATSNPVRLPVR